MTSTAVKICGITTPATLEATIAARADYVGFVFYPPSPRYLALRDASMLADQAGLRIAKVGLFVDAKDDLIAEAITAGKLDAVQLHGFETPERVSQVKKRFGIDVWKALPVASQADVEASKAYQESADLILFDAKTPKGALPGGMGLVFDWSLLAAWHSPTRWGLAGGLHTDNVAEALRITHAPLVDASSGVESAPGVKDMDRITAFCQAARQS